MPTWDDRKKFRLLLTIITVLDVKTPNWDTVAQKMGDGLTAEAVRQQYNKIKKTANAELGPGVSAAATPTPRRRNGTTSNAGTPSKSAGKRGKAAKNYAEENDDDDDDDEENSRLVSPSKKQKVEDDAFDGDIAKVKTENGDDEEDYYNAYA